MANFQWQFDAPAGIFRQHELSSQLYQAAVAQTKMMDHVKPIPSFGKKMGEAVAVTRISAIAEPATAVLSEGVRIPEDSYAISTKTITIKEIGRAVPFTSFAQDLSKFDLENSIQAELVRQKALVLDTMSAVAFKLAKIKYAVTGLTSSTITTNGTFGATSSAAPTIFHLEEIRDYLYDTIRTPPAEGDDYIGIFRTASLRGIKRDPDFEEWYKYTDPSAKFNSEVGKIEQIRLQETNHSQAFGLVGTGSVLGEGVVFGADTVAMAEVQTPELRAAMATDFGRQHAVAWYGILNFDIIWDTGNAGEARIVHVGSA